MDTSSPVEANPFKRLRPVLVDDDQSHTENTSSPTLPLMVRPLRTVRPFPASDDVNDETHHTTTPPPQMVTPLGTIRPFDDSNNDSFAADAGPSTGPIKRGRGRPKGSKKPRKKRITYDPNNRLCCPNFDSEITDAERDTGNQELVDLVMMRFDAVRRRLCQVGSVQAVLTNALISCNNLGVGTNMKRRIGEVPGVHVGDIFYFWGEMSLGGLHMQNVAGIDYLTVKDGATGGPIATSVVTSGHYNDETEELHTLVYTGQGGMNRMGQASDQKLKKGNRALHESVRIGNEVRVIRGEEDPNNKKKKIYVYDGLYLVTKFWNVKGKSGFKEFKFRLVRKPGQPSGYEVWKSVRKWMKSGLRDSRKGLILEDLSSETEALPVPVVNEIDDNDKKKPEDFSYITSLTCSKRTIDLDLMYRLPGCSNCQGRSCSAQDPNCSCVQRNGGELPYHNRILVCRKPMVYECGDSCACPQDCKNRVIQSGLKIRVEVFKTENCGWGLRSWEPIRAGTFICEFAGMSKTKVEEDDEYLFDSSRGYNRFRWNYEPELVDEDSWEQVSEEFNLPSRILISAKKHGNIGRFMNHSCSPNVMWQPIVCEENGDPRVHIGFFAIKHIPPLTELRYDYGMSREAEEVVEDGRLLQGKKICLCASVKCRGSFG